MNLSKIATGIVASFCLVTSAYSNSYQSMSLKEKAEMEFNQIYQKNKEQINFIDNPRMGFSEFNSLPDQIKKAYKYYKTSKALEQWTNSFDESILANFTAFEILNRDVNQSLNTIKNNEVEIKESKIEFKKGIKDISDKISGLEKDINANKVKADKNEKSVSSNKKSIETNAKSIMENRGIITESSKKISDNRELIGNNTQNIAMMMGIADKNAKAISANSKMIEEMRSSFNTRLNHLKRDLKRGLATQSALNGLFQPYSVGKFNLTAAFGGYQSQTAIAIGTGYRFNERIAAKA